MTLALRGIATGFLLVLCARVPATQGNGAPSHESTLSGRVTLLLPPKVVIDPGGSVVWIPGIAHRAHTSSNSGAAPLTPSVTSKAKRFDPRVLVVSSGTKVTFPNVDSIYHNAFSLSPGNAFDLGLYRKGASRDVVMKTPGIVRIYCNIHPDMAASVLVVDGNAFSMVEADGSYLLQGITPGKHDVHLWSDMAGEQVMSLVFESGRSTEWNPILDATQYRRMGHLNKHGKAYPKAKNDADRY